MTTVGYWRRRARDVIRATMLDHPGADGPAMKRLLRAAYPFGERRHTPYKIWLEEVKRALVIIDQAEFRYYAEELEP
jgi:hypothetical protein